MCGILFVANARESDTVIVSEDLLNLINNRGPDWHGSGGTSTLEYPPADGSHVVSTATYNSVKYHCDTGIVFNLYASVLQLRGHVLVRQPVDNDSTGTYFTCGGLVDWLIVRLSVRLSDCIDWLIDWLIALIGSFLTLPLCHSASIARSTSYKSFWILNLFYRESVRVERWAIWRYKSHWKWHGIAVATTCFLSRRFWAHFSSLEQEPRPVCIRLPRPHNRRLLLRTGSFWATESDLACHTQRRIPPVVCGAARDGKRRQLALWRSQSTWIVQNGERRRGRAISFHIPKVDCRLGWRRTCQRRRRSC